jgi:hypothetical protein
MHNGNRKEPTRFEFHPHYERSFQQPQNNKLMFEVLGTIFLIHTSKTEKQGYLVLATFHLYLILCALPPQIPVSIFPPILL